MSSLENPWSEPEPPLGEARPPVPPSRWAENPPWTGWDVLRILVVMLASLFFFLFVLTYIAGAWLYPGLPAGEVVKNPLISVAAQFFAYLVVLIYMIGLVCRPRARRFWKAISWKWPQNWAGYLLLGFVLSVVLQGLAHLLPIPKQLPMDRFFQTSLQAWVLSIFGMTLAPLMEELFFRGFLYPVLVRRLGLVLGILLTAIGFGLVHAQQLGESWAPILVVFLVGVVLTIVRAVTKSVASTFLIHVAYNSTISILLFFGTDGFRHLEKLNQ